MKQDDHGRWPYEKHPKGGGWMKKCIEFEEIGQQSKWITLQAMKVLKDLYTGNGNLPLLVLHRKLFLNNLS